MLVTLNNQGSFFCEEVQGNLVVSVNGRKFAICYDRNDQAHIGYEGRKLLVNWF